MNPPDERRLEGTALPARLADLDTPPAALFARGEFPRGPLVALVGTRYPSEQAVAYTESLSRELVQAGVSVISGGAEGIDTAAHRGTLAANGVTVVMAPAGFEHPFPEENRELFENVVACGGAYLSLVEHHTPATRGIFFQRNACLVALAHVVVVIEAPVRSGARNAAAKARRLGRPLFVVPYPPWHGKGQGCVAELKLGARPLAGVRDVLKVLDQQRLHPLSVDAAVESSQSGQQSLGFPETLQPHSAREALLETVRRGASLSDEIVAQTGLPVAQVAQLILTLRLEGVLVADPAGRIEFSK
ncbi:MAG TPA: DNA-processing protein DprA [Polyangiaceae bacterium]|jgi:DNA processing protein